MELVKRTIGDCLTLRAKQSPDKIAIEYWDKSYTWEELDRITDYMAVRMSAFGMVKGDHVGIWSVNTPNWIITFLALEKLGAIPVLINTCYRECELRRIIEYADIRYMYYGDGYKSMMYLPVVEQLQAREWCRVERWIPIGRDSEGKWLTDRSFFTAEKSRKELTRLSRLRNQIRPEDTAAMLFTSGTTSAAKGVLLSHFNLVNSALGTLEFTRWTAQDKLFLVVPLFHCFGITSGLLTSIHVGCTIHLLKYFKTIKVLEHIDKYRCTVLSGVPSMFLAMIRREEFDRFSLRSLKSGILAGSPISEREYMAIHEKLPWMDLLPSYGQTETSPCVTLMVKEDPFKKRADSAGRLISHVKLRIVNPDTDQVLEAGGTGEIEVRGYNIMQGYYKKPEETAAVLRPDGWLRTGDLGYMDQDGYLHIAGRRKEMIIRCGENISPLEIETCIKELAFVRDVKVIGVPAEVVQEKIAACIVPKAGMSCSEKQVLSYLEPRLAHYKIPSHVLWFDALPMNASGKVLISELKNQVIDRLKQVEQNNAEK